MPFTGFTKIEAPQYAYRMRRVATPEPTANRLGQFDLTRKTAPDPYAAKLGNFSFPPPEREEEEQSGIPPFNRAMPDYSKLYEDTGPAYQKYQQHLSQVPRMEDYAPSKWRRFGAILAGLGSAVQGKNGYETARGITLDPYATAYENWANQGQGVREAATLEEGAASRKANIWQKILSDYMEQQRWELDYQIKMQNAKTAAERNAITRAFNEATSLYRNRMADITGQHYSRMDANDATANTLRGEANDINRYGITRRGYDAQKARELDRELANTRPSTTDSQLDADQIATDQMFREMSNDARYKDAIDQYFVINQYGAPIMVKQNLPDPYNQKYQNARNQAIALARGWGRY